MARNHLKARRAKSSWTKPRLGRASCAPGSQVVANVCHTVGSGPQDQWTRSPDPQRANRRYTGGQGDPPQFSRNWGNPWETIFWWGLGGNWHAQRPPGYHTIHLGQGKSPNLHFRNHSSTKPCFSDSILGPRNLPRPVGASLATQQILDNGRSRGYPGQGQG